MGNRSAPGRLGLRALTVVALAIGFTVAASGPADAATTLRQAAEAKSIYFGTALTQGNLGTPALTAVAGTQFDMVTPGNEMKWDTTEASRGSFNFGPGDAIVSFATAHTMRVRGHNLVWHSQLPGWVAGLPLNQVQAAMENHITTEVTHYRGQIYAWDVVNEPFNEDGTPRQDVFYNAFGGSGYIADALRTAHAADPNAKLYLNDYNIEGTGAKSNAMYSLVQSLIAQGVPINGVGFESHFILGQVPSTMQANLARFAALGLDVAVTELDDRIQLPATTANLAQQASDYAAVVNDCLGVSRCVGVTQWGVGDADSWIPGFFSGFGAATMYDNNYQPKPAYTSTLTALGGGSTGNTVTVANPGNQTGRVGTAASLTVHATDSASGQTFTWSATGLPAGLSINATTGVISGTPTAAGTSSVVVTARDTTNATGSAAFTWAVTSGGGGGTHACAATFQNTNDWGNGFTANVTVTNTGTAATTTWKVTWTWGGNQVVTNMWNAAGTQTGTAETATNMPYNNAIAPGASTQFGFQASYTGTNAAPALSCTTT